MSMAHSELMIREMNEINGNSSEERVFLYPLNSAFLRKKYW